MNLSQPARAKLLDIFIICTGCRNTLSNFKQEKQQRRTIVCCRGKIQIAPEQLLTSKVGCISFAIRLSSHDFKRPRENNALPSRLINPNFSITGLEKLVSRMPYPVTKATSYGRSRRRVQASNQWPSPLT